MILMHQLGTSNDAVIYSRIADLSRICCNCDYLFFYAQELIAAVLLKLEVSLDNDISIRKRKLSETENNHTEGKLEIIID